MLIGMTQKRQGVVNAYIGNGMKMKTLNLNNWADEFNPCGECPFNEICEEGPCDAVKQMFLEFVWAYVRNGNSTKKIRP